MNSSHPLARRLNTELSVWLVWIVAHVVSLAIIQRQIMPEGDVEYYYRSLVGVVPGGLQEYPAVGVWPLTFLQDFIGRGEDEFIVWFQVLCMIVDAVFLAVLLRSRSPHRITAGYFWAVFCLLALHVQFLRLDIFTGVLVGVAGLFFFRNPTVSAHLLGWATAMKLWPGVLAVTIVQRRLRPVWMFVGTLAALCAVVVLRSDVHRLFSPLTYQGDRGLQIESIAATPFMVRELVQPGTYSVSYAASKSFEISGPGVDAAATACSWALVAAVLLCALWGVVGLVRKAWSPRTALLSAIVIVMLMLDTNKVFSPQYIMWLAPLVAVSLAYLADSRLIQLIGALVVVMAVLGSQLFPYHYDQIWNTPFTGSTGVILLAVRNVLVLVITIVVIVAFMRSVREDATENTANSANSGDAESALRA